MRIGDIRSPCRSRRDAPLCDATTPVDVPVINADLQGQWSSARRCKSARRGSQSNMRSVMRRSIRNSCSCKAIVRLFRRQSALARCPELSQVGFEPAVIWRMSAYRAFRSNLLIWKSFAHLVLGQRTRVLGYGAPSIERAAERKTRHEIQRGPTDRPGFSPSGGSRHEDTAELSSQAWRLKWARQRTSPGKSRRKRPRLREAPRFPKPPRSLQKVG